MCVQLNLSINGAEMLFSKSSAACLCGPLCALGQTPPHGRYGLNNVHRDSCRVTSGKLQSFSTSSQVLQKRITSTVLSCYLKLRLHLVLSCHLFHVIHVILLLDVEGGDTFPKNDAIKQCKNSLYSSYLGCELDSCMTAEITGLSVNRKVHLKIKYLARTSKYLSEENMRQLAITLAQSHNNYT